MKYLIPYVQAAQKVNPQPPLLGQPLDAADLDEDVQRQQLQRHLVRQGRQHQLRRRLHERHQREPDGVRQLPREVGLGLQGHGITIDTIAPQNEPNYAQGYPSCLWNTADYMTFIKGHLATAFPSGGSTKIMLGTMSNGDNGASSFDLKVVQGVEPTRAQGDPQGHGPAVGDVGPRPGSRAAAVRRTS